MLSLTYTKEDIEQKIKEKLESIDDNLPEKEYLLRIDNIAQSLTEVRDTGTETDSETDAIELDFRKPNEQEKEILKIVDSLLKEYGIEPNAKTRQDMINVLKIINKKPESIKPRNRVLTGKYKEVLEEAKTTPYTDVVLDLSQEEMFSDIKAQIFRNNGRFTAVMDRDEFEKYVLRRHFKEIVGKHNGRMKEYQLREFIKSMYAGLKFREENINPLTGVYSLQKIYKIMNKIGSLFSQDSVPAREVVLSSISEAMSATSWWGRLVSRLSLKETQEVFKTYAGLVEEGSINEKVLKSVSEVILISAAICNYVEQYLIFINRLSLKETQDVFKTYTELVEEGYINEKVLESVSKSISKSAREYSNKKYSKTIRQQYVLIPLRIIGSKISDFYRGFRGYLR